MIGPSSHLPLLLQILGTVPLHCMGWPGAQSALQTPGMIVCTSHCPCWSHLDCVVSLHLVAPGVHWTPQAFILRTPSDQEPVLLQVCCIGPTQRVSFGMQEPVHVPFEQRYGHWTPDCHFPVSSHV